MALIIGAVSVALHVTTPTNVYNHYRAMIQLRHVRLALRQGEFIPIASNVRAVYSFLRHTPE